MAFNPDDFAAPKSGFNPDNFAAPVQQPQPSYADMAIDNAGNFGAGAIKGASDIGATILSPLDYAARKLRGGQPLKALGAASIAPFFPSLADKLMSQVPEGSPLEVGGFDILGQDRRDAVTNVLQNAGANPKSLAYKAGDVAAGIAGTAGVGGLLGKGVLAAAPNATKLATALESGGLSGGANLPTRMLAGSATGGASAGLINPDEAKTGALIGGAIPIAGAIPEGANSAARSLMWSALKPLQKAQRTGQADQAIDTLLKYGINPTSGGVEKMSGMIGDLNDQIAQKIANSNVNISKQDVLNSLGEVSKKFGNQVAPTSDLNAIEGVGQEFLAHPSIPTDEIPVQLAQTLKQGTYKVLSGKYGEAGSASTEAQKALARALKEQIASNVPEVGGLNALESELINAKNIAERRALMDMNKNPLGLSTLTHNPTNMALAMADKSALVKSLLARGLNATGQGAEALGGVIPQPLTNTALVVAGSNKQPSTLSDQQRLAMALMTEQQKQDYLKKLGAQ